MKNEETEEMSRIQEVRIWQDMEYVLYLRHARVCNVKEEHNKLLFFFLEKSL